MLSPLLITTTTVTTLISWVETTTTTILKAEAQTYPASDPLDTTLVTTITMPVEGPGHGPTAPSDLKSARDWNGSVLWGQGQVDSGAGKETGDILENLHFLLIFCSGADEEE